MASSTSGDILPSGGKIFTSIPDFFFIPEFVLKFHFHLMEILIVYHDSHIVSDCIVFGGLVWMLVASTQIAPVNPLGWVMFVSVFCFVVTTLWFFIFLCGANQSSIWPALDAGYHFVAVVLYLSASVALAYITVLYGSVAGLLSINNKIYRLDIAAVVMSYLVTLLYFLHAIFSAIRWKRS